VKQKRARAASAKQPSVGRLRFDAPATPVVRARVADLVDLLGTGV
jgi:hypothetical protein